MSLDRDAEVDRLLREAGAAWRAGQAVGLDVDPAWFADATRPARVRSLIAAVAGLVVVGIVVVVVAVTMPSRPNSAGVTVPSPTTAPTMADTPAPPQPSPTVVPPTVLAPTPSTSPLLQVISEGDAVTAAGNLLVSPTGEVMLCPRAVASGFEPSMVGCSEHTTVAVTGLDVQDLPGRQQVDYWVSDYVLVTGTWSNGAILASGAEPTDRPEGSGGRKVPCSTPSGGWPGNQPAADHEDAVERLEATIAGRPDEYSGLWVARIGDTDETALVVGTVGDVEAKREELTATFPYNLCVIAVEFSAAELQRIERELKAAGGPWQTFVDVTIDRVRVTTAVLDVATAEALAPYADSIDLELTVEHAP